MRGAICVFVSFVCMSWIFVFCGGGYAVVVCLVLIVAGGGLCLLGWLWCGTDWWFDLVYCGFGVVISLFLGLGM